jgi:hypothetical protein
MTRNLSTAGVKLDRDLLQAFQDVRGPIDDVAVKEKIAPRISDANTLTQAEINTVTYALDNFDVKASGANALRETVVSLPTSKPAAASVLAQRLELTGPSHLNKHMLDGVDINKLFRDAQSIAMTKMYAPQLQRVDFSGRGDKPGVLFAFINPVGDAYNVRLNKTGAKVWEADFGRRPGALQFETVPDLSSLKTSPAKAFKAAFARLPNADWNNAGISIKGGKLYYTFWNSYAWQKQPTVAVNVDTGKASIKAR